MLIHGLLALLALITQADLQSQIDDGGLVDLRGETVVLDDHLWIHGDVKILGGSLRIDGDPRHGRFFVCAGVRGYGANRLNGLYSPWTGSINGTRFITTRRVTKPLRVLNVFACRGVAVRNCTFDLRASGSVPIGAVAAMNHSDFSNPSPRLGITYENNRVLAEQGVHGNEGLNVTVARDVVVRNNFIEGVGDDPIGLHGVHRFRVTQNHCRSLDGRIYASGSTDGQIDQNEVHRTSSIGGGGLIWLEIEGAYNDRPRNITIRDNDIHHHPGVQSFTYGIRVLGGDQITITGNRIWSGSGNGHGISIEPQRMQDAIIPVGAMRIAGNVAPDIIEGAIGSTQHNHGPITRYGNKAKVIRFFSPQPSK